MKTLHVQQHIMDDLDYNVSDRSSSDEEKDCMEVHSSAVDMLDIFQVCFSLHCNEYFTTFHFFFE